MTRLVILPFVAAAMVVGTCLVAPVEATGQGGSAALAKPCCRTVEANCCGSACCRTPADTSQRAPSTLAERPGHRWQDQQLTWLRGGLFYDGFASEALRFGHFSPWAPHSGSPSLIAAHIRLQI